MDGLKLSILTPSVPSRWASVMKLHEELARQIGDGPAEHLILTDNKRRTIGEKRQALLDVAQGDYVVFVDDDDWVLPDYVSELLAAMVDKPDVITFLQSSVINGVVGEIEFKLGNPNEVFKPGGVTKRNAWHVCAWRREVATQSRYPAVSYGEDWRWAEPLCALSWVKEQHVPKVLHEYRYSTSTSEASSV